MNWGSFIEFIIYSSLVATAAFVFLITIRSRFTGLLTLNIQHNLIAFGIVTLSGIAVGTIAVALISLLPNFLVDRT